MSFDLNKRAVNKAQGTQASSAEVVGSKDVGSTPVTLDVMNSLLESPTL